MTKKNFGKNLLDVLKRYIFIILGCAIYGFGNVAFIQSMHTVNGGITGVLNLINIIHEIPVGILYFIINVPLLIISFIFLGWRFSVSTLIGTFISSGFITLFENTIGGLRITENYFIAAVFGGFALGVGLGIIMRYGSSTGGSDIIMKLLHKKFPFLSGGTINILIDVAILVAYLFVIKDFDMVVYALVVVVIENITYDLVLYGTMGSKTVYIITEKSDNLIPALLRLDVGATIINGTGAYTQNKKKVVLCVVKNNMFPELKNTVKETDDKAFMIVNKSFEIYGEGYKDYYKEVL